MRVRFLAVARDEFSNAVSYYDSQKEGLGEEFADEVWRTISRIVSHPLAWQRLSKAQALPHQEVPIRSGIPGEVGFDTDRSGDAFTPTSRELAWTDQGGIVLRRHRKESRCR
jgi:hypothetical protein